MIRHRLPRIVCWLLPLLSIGVLVGCGGGGGSDNPDDKLPAACGKSAYLPNFADGDGRTSMILHRWKTLPVRVYLDTNSVSYTPQLHDRAVTAFNSWVTNSDGRATYVLVANRDEAEVAVHFVPVGDTNLPTNTVGITYTQESRDTTGLPYGRSYLASVEMYIGMDGDTVREDGTLTHEFGHALGVGGHSPNRIDVMYRTGSAMRSPVPTTSDINTLRTAYCDDFTQASPEGRAIVPPEKRGPRIAIP